MTKKWSILTGLLTQEDTSHRWVYSLIFSSVFLSAGRLTSWIFTDYFCHEKGSLSHFFFSFIYMFWKKNDSSLILKYISRKTKDIFWKLGRKRIWIFAKNEKMLGSCSFDQKILWTEHSANSLVFVYFMKKMSMKYSELWKYILVPKEYGYCYLIFVKSASTKYMKSLKGCYQCLSVYSGPEQDFYFLLTYFWIIFFYNKHVFFL